jgi:hypothetical protein
VTIDTSNFGLRASHFRRVMVDHTSFAKGAGLARARIEREAKDLRPEAAQQREADWSKNYGDKLRTMRAEMQSARQQLAADAQRLVRTSALSWMLDPAMPALLQVVNSLPRHMLPIAAELAADRGNKSLAGALRVAVLQVQDLDVHKAVTTALAPLQDDTEKSVREMFAKVLDDADALDRHIDVAVHGENYIDGQQLLTRHYERERMLADLARDTTAAAPSVPAMLQDPAEDEDGDE